MEVQKAEDKSLPSNCVLVLCDLRNTVIGGKMKYTEHWKTKEENTNSRL
jgi:hypothetical protein